MKGKLVVFTRAETALSPRCGSRTWISTASAKVTAEAQGQAAAPPAAGGPEKKLAVLTDKDFRQSPRPPAAKPAAAASDGGRPRRHAGAARGRQRTGKRLDRPAGDGIEIAGQPCSNTTGRDRRPSVGVDGPALSTRPGDGSATARACLTSTSIQPRRHGRVPGHLPGGLHLRRGEVRGPRLPDQRRLAGPEAERTSVPAVARSAAQAVRTPLVWAPDLSHAYSGTSAPPPDRAP